MKEEVRQLRKAQKILNDMQYPGYPFQISLLIDTKKEIAYVDYYKGQRPVKLQKALDELAQAVAYRGLGCYKATKGTWLQDCNMDSPKELIKADNDDYYIDDVNVVKLYYAVYSALRESKDKDNLIFACCDDDTEYVECKVFKSHDKKRDTTNYIKNYWTC